MQTEEQRLTKILTENPRVYDMLDPGRTPAHKAAASSPALDVAVESIRKADGNLTREQATVKALNENPKLYEAEG